MKKTLLCVMAGAALLGGAATEARSQEMEMMNRRAPRFDFGVYAGGAVSSRWYESSLNVPTDFEGDLEDDEGVAYKIGYAPVFGANATYWATPMFGVRAHYGYMPSKPPIASDGFFDIFQEWEDGLPLNNHFYDLNLVFRPFVMQPDVSSTLSSVYFFVGGGGLTTDHASGFLDEIGDGNDLGPDLDEEDDFDGFDICEPGALTRGVCFPLEGDNATVGQGVIGAGIDLLGFGDNFALFGEAAVHGYDSPVHTSPGFTGFPETEAAEDKFAFTTRIVAGVKYLVGNILPPPPPVVPVAPEPLPPPPPPVEPVTQPIRICVVQGPAIVEVDAVFNPATGDTAIVVEGVEQPFAQVFPATAPEYAAGQQFFIDNEEITVMDQRFVRFGLPRVITPTDVARVGEFQGVGVFAEAGAATPPQVIYLPVRPGCEFQPYQQAEEVGRVRG